MFECKSCDDEFYYWDDCCDHMDEDSHWPECETCPRTFNTWAACNQHMNALNHWAPTFDCETCDKTFRSQSAANQHMRNTNHWKPTHPCKECNRGFTNENNLRMHLHSRTHQGSTITCPFCSKPHTTASGLSHHLETGSCPQAPRLNHDTILQLIRSRDPTGMITTKQLTYHPTGTYTATDLAYNGHAWECYLCHRNFKTDHALTQHLGSPTHQQKVYRCPNRGRCGKEFVALAGLFNHLESESCAYMRFERVQQQVQGVFAQGSCRLLTLG